MSFLRHDTSGRAPGSERWTLGQVTRGTNLPLERVLAAIDKHSDRNDGTARFHQVRSEGVSYLWAGAKRGDKEGFSRRRP